MVFSSQSRSPGEHLFVHDDLHVVFSGASGSFRIVEDALEALEFRIIWVGRRCGTVPPDCCAIQARFAERLALALVLCQLGGCGLWSGVCYFGQLSLRPTLVVI